MVLPIVILFCTVLQLSTSYPQQGVKSAVFDENHRLIPFTKTVYKDASLFIKVHCDVPAEENVKINISYYVQMQPCFVEDLVLTPDEQSQPILEGKFPSINQFAYYMFKSNVYSTACSKDEHIILPSIENPEFKEYPGPKIVVSDERVSESASDTSKDQDSIKDKAEPVEAKNPSSLKKDSKSATNAKVKRGAKDSEQLAAIPSSTVGKAELPKADDDAAGNQSDLVDKNKIPPQLVLKNEGVYIIYVSITTSKLKDVRGTVDIKLEGSYGYLSAVDWPLLPFYGVMCGIYVLYGVVWLLVSACQWRDLLRIQFWIGGVILLGMLEKAVFYAEYQAINSTGRSVLGAVMVAEIVSCLKRALARMLVIIVSLGFGIVKPRLGPLLHRVVGIGTLYFILSVFEAYIRVYTLRNNPYRQYLLADMLLAVLDSFICWWIFSSLVQTTRTLRLRRNIVKLSLYRHFTNTLIFAVIASVAFMVWSVTNHKKPSCVTDWKEMWVEEGYWRLLFSTILLVIMILWRPTNNNQRYAFTPLLDAPDDEEDETVMSDAFDGMKMRPSKNHTVKDNQTKGVDDDLKWVEENIPSTIADVALPSLLDSDEEIMTTKFEISKMN